jgi:hypothetical protein
MRILFGRNSIGLRRRLRRKAIVALYLAALPAALVDLGYSGLLSTASASYWHASSVDLARAAWRISHVDLGKVSFGLSAAPQLTSPSLSPSPKRDPTELWVGTWDTVTSDGIAFSLRFIKQGGQIVGRTPHVDRRSIFRFRSTPNPAGNEMSFILTHPATGLTRTGLMRLTGKDTFVGTFIEENHSGKKVTWRGTRRQ